ncbi:hypothetical protein DERF_005479 [Dermatophagoides farinae]|uniref:Uncharacterized protein n=1 Tax=Dermatophagoides farinae TaxID=6954 RepID=A0A922I5Q5_DERFA|nr:hypothetical protein DERF_005479 [Dermatophagoides farinae]
MAVVEFATMNSARLAAMGVSPLCPDCWWLSCTGDTLCHNEYDPGYFLYSKQIGLTLHRYVSDAIRWMVSGLHGSRVHTLFLQRRSPCYDRAIAEN